MDIVSYSYADRQSKRIKKFIHDPDSNSGIVTMPKVIETGESVTVPSGRTAMLFDIQVEGELNVENGGDVLIVSGSIPIRDVVVLKAPDDSLWTLKVSNTGELSTEVYSG